MPFNPTSIAGLRVWLDAAQITGLADTDPVAGWPNLVVSESETFTQSTPAARPLYRTAQQNGLPGVSFDGVDDYLLGSVSRTLKPVTAFAVVRPIDFAGYRGIVGEAPGGPVGPLITRFAIISGQLQIFGGPGYELNVYSGSAATADIAGQWDWSYSATGGWLMGLNGSDDASGTANATITATPPAIGIADGAHYMKGLIHEVLIYDTVLTPTDRQAVRDYLVDKWLTAPPHGGGETGVQINVAATGGGIRVDTQPVPPRMRTWRVEAWTHPRKGTPEFITEVPYRTLHMADRRDAIVDSDITIPEGADVLDLIAVADPTDPSAGVSTLLRCFPVDTDPDFVDPLLPDFEFFAARRDSEIGEDAESYAKISGPDIRAGANDAQLLPWDYPGTEIDGGRRTRFPDWQWGGNNIADNGDLEGGATNTIQQVWITDAASGVTALNGAVDGAVGTVVVDTAVGFPSVDGFTILVDSERMRVTGGAGTTTWTVTRGVDGTTPAAHSDGATVGEVAAGTFTLTFDGESTTALPWNPEGGGTTVDATGLKTALETLPNIIAVDVNGSGTPGDPFTVEFVDPAGAVPTLGGSDTITGGDLAAGLITQQGGIPTASPWTRSYNPGTGLNHGIYASNGVTGEDVFDYGAITGTGSLWVYGSSLFAGAQQIVTVPPGALVQFAVNHRTTETSQTYAFVVRDLNEQLVGPNAYQRYSPAPDTVTAMELVDVVIPDNVDQVIVRVGVVGPEGLTRSWWQIDDLVVRVGYPPATKGAIALTVLDDLQTAHTPRTRLGWLTPGFTATHDSAGIPWTSEIEFAARWRDRFGTDFADRLFRETGGDWDIEPVLVGGEPVGWELRAWEVGSRGVDRTADIDPAFIIGAGIQGGSVSHAEPPFTALTVANDDGIFVELEDTDLVAAYGVIDGGISDGAFRNTTAMTEVAAAALHNVLVNQVSAQTRIGPGGPIPWAEFQPGDTVTFALAGRVNSAHGRVISQITVDVSPTGWNAEVTASRLFTGIAAAEEGIRLLLERVENLERAADTTGSVAVLQPPGLRIPGLVAGADAAPEWKTAASFVCDGSNDSAVLQAVADAAWFGNGPEQMIVAGSFVLTEALALRGGVALVGVGANIDGGSGAYFEREGGPVITLNNGGNRIANVAVVGIGADAPAVSAISLADLVITDCYLWADGGPTLRLDGVSMAWVTRCRILQGGTSPTVYWSNAKASHLTECVMEYGGILIDGDTNDMTVSGNLVSFAEGDGIRVSDGAVRVRVAHNVVEDAQEHGIVVDDTTAQVDNVWVHNNAVVGAGYGSDNAFDGILIAGSPIRVDVRDNRVAAQAGATRMRWGINPSDTCVEVHIVGNDLTLEGTATFGSGPIRTGSAGDFDLALPADPTYGANWT